MKLLVALKFMLFVGIFILSAPTASAVSPKNYIYETQEENGLLQSKIVYTQDKGLLNKEVKFVFTYNDKGKVSEKKALRWNKNSEIWEPTYRITYRYDENKGVIHSFYGMWDKKKKDYNLNVQELDLSISEYDSIFL